jgi:hypothetical protein
MPETTAAPALPARLTFGDVCLDAFTEWGKRMCANATYRPFAARFVSDGRAELHPDDHFVGLTTREFRQHVKTETSWVEQKGTRPVFKSLPFADQDMIASGLMECPCCAQGDESPVYVGKDTGVEITTFHRCRCAAIRAFVRVWRRDVPVRFRACKLTTLAPSAHSKLPMDRQEKVIDFLREHPTDSYLFVGDGGVGKTHMSFALHRYALEAWAQRVHQFGSHYPSVLRASVPELMKQHHAWSMRSSEHEQGMPVQVPTITIEKIKAIVTEGNRPTIILDEIDKVGNVTPAKLTVLYDLVNTAYEAKGQIIATSNTDAETLRKLWSKDQDEWASQMAGVITRRCGDDEGARTITLRVGA